MEPNKDLVDELSEELGEALSLRLTKWLEDGKDLSFGSWQREVVEELEEPMVQYLIGPYANSLIRRGITPLGVEEARVIVERALFDARDIYKTLLNAPMRDLSLTAGFFVDTLLRRLHQGRVVNSLLHRVRDLFGGKSVEAEVVAGTGFTGRKMWRVNVASSRHRHLNGVVKEDGEMFEVAPGVFWPGPRADIFAVNLSSGCRCELLFEYINEDGSVTWR